MSIKKIVFFLLLAVAFAGSSAMAATIHINNVDSPGQGLNDPTKVKPVGKNKGTTLGQQRMNVFLKAAEIWGSTLQSNVPIWVQATFQDRGFTPCTANSAVLGAATTIQIFANSANALWPNTWYHSALANKLANADQQPGSPDPGFLAEPFADDIIAFFNPNLGKPDCLAGTTWYYGVDNQAPAGTTDFLNVVLHEMGHGLGHAGFADKASGVQDLGLPDVYGVYSRDNTADKQFNQMTNNERAASIVNTGNLVWNGPSVKAAAPSFLGPVEELQITAPSSIAGTVLNYGTANFGPLPTTANFSGQVALANDGVGTTSDACEPIVNGSALSGRIALIDRGICSFTIKVKNAQNAGAIGAIVANNVAGGGAFGLGGTDTTIVIPAIGISLEQGTLIRNNLPVSVAIIRDTSRLAGADAAGNVRLYAPATLAGGSSWSHWDTVANPNLLMEPFITSTLKGATSLDLSPNQMADIGWSGQLSCPANSDQGSVVQIGSCNTGVANDFGPFTLIPNGSNGQVFGGCTVSDIVNSASDSSTLAQATSALRSAGVITEAEKEAILACSGSL